MAPRRGHPLKAARQPLHATRDEGAWAVEVMGVPAFAARWARDPSKPASVVEVRAVYLRLVARL